MRNRIGFSWGVALTLLLTAPVASNAGKAHRPTWMGWHKALQLEPFSLSANYSGALGGEIQIDGVSYRLTPDATIYEIGQGPMRLGTVVSDRTVFLSGVKRGTSILIQSLIVRPAADPGALLDYPSRHVSETHEPAPE